MVLSIQPTAALLATIDYVCRKPPNSVLPEFDRYNGANRLNGPTLAIAREGHWSLKGLEGLTKREHEIIALVGQGLSNKDIADRLCICSTTVRHHLTRIFGKLGVTSRQKLLIRVYQQGLVKLKTTA